MNKRLVNKVAAHFGFELHRHIPRDSHVARLRRMLDHHEIDLVLDVGANVGDYALHLRDCGYGGRILSFEPLSTAHSALTAASQNDALWAVAERAAIGDKNGEITIHVSQNSYSSSILEVDAGLVKVAPDIACVSQEVVPLRRLDHLAAAAVAASRNVFLKIDVQGFERQVIDGATAIFPRISGIQIELSVVAVYTGQPLYQEMMRHIDSLGYDLHAVIPGFTDAATGRMLQMDGIFFRRSES